ncbi:MAG: hypothetical protein ACI80F_000767, partial [Natronomonas sp.]
LRVFGGEPSMGDKSHASTHMTVNKCLSSADDVSSYIKACQPVKVVRREPGTRFYRLAAR